MLFAYGAIALGSWLVFSLTTALTKSDLAGFILTLSCVLSEPRPYAYPKILIYPLAVALLWRYIRRPSSGNVALLGFFSAVALMVRIDHGATLMITGAVVVFTRQVFESKALAVRSVAILGAWTLVGMSPFLVYLAVSGGIVHHFLTILEFGGYALTQSAPLQLQVTGLASNASRPNVAIALVHDSYVVLTGIAVATVGVRATREWRSAGCFAESTHRLLAVVAMWLVAAPMLVRDGFPVRFPDVAPILALLAAGIVAGIRDPLRQADGAPTPSNTGARWWSLSGVVRTTAAVGVVAALFIPVAMTHDGLPGIESAAQQAVRDAGGLFDEFAASPPRSAIRSYPQVVRYASECTEPLDRLLVTWYAPEIFFGAKRRFAGNQWLYIDYQNSLEQQREVLGQMQEQRIPLVFARPGEPLFAGLWPLLAEHVESAYVQVGSLDGATVYVDRSREPVRASSFEGLPCFTAPEMANLTTP